MIPERFRYFAVDGFIQVYLMGLGEFTLDQYMASPYQRLVFIFFFIATFLITIVFLNMMIAIMGDAFAMATE